MPFRAVSPSARLRSGQPAARLSGPVPAARLRELPSPRCRFNAPRLSWRFAEVRTPGDPRSIRLSNGGVLRLSTSERVLLRIPGAR